MPTIEAKPSVFSPDIPALPRGYTGVPRQLVEASQRQRLLHGVTLAVAEKGFGSTRIADITTRAGVSKKTFYEHFADKTECFLAAYDHGREAMLAAVNDAGWAAAREGLDPVEQLHRATRAYVSFLEEEEVYARTFCLEILAAGPEAVARHRACRMSFAESLRAWHALARSAHPDWPPASDIAYEAATGAAHELTLARIADGRADELAALEDDIVDVQLATLRVPAAPAA